jgi:hypothetical protein
MRSVMRSVTPASAPDMIRGSTDVPKIGDAILISRLLPATSRRRAGDRYCVPDFWESR